MTRLHRRLLILAEKGRLRYEVGSHAAKFMAPFAEALERNGWVKRFASGGFMAFQITDEGARHLRRLLELEG
ncbi:hypothetical protein [Alsobacter sp. SYSU BS001988]